MTVGKWQMVLAEFDNFDFWCVMVKLWFLMMHECVDNTLLYEALARVVESY